MGLLYPEIIQGGMGVGVSDWRLARTVSMAGELGVVSGTGVGVLLARRLQAGDPDGDMRRALEAFPVSAVARRVLDKYFVPGGKDPNKRFKPVPMYTPKPLANLTELIVVGNFVEVWLAKEGHNGLVGVNFLEKIQRPHLASIYGAMLAGVDYVLMGAGIPTQIPGILDAFANHDTATYRLDVIGAQPGDNFDMTFNPRTFMPDATSQPMTRPTFLAIIASALLAKVLVAKSSGTVNGFVVEGPTAGGHNAPPRGKMQLDERGQPIYGERDLVDFAKLREIGLPFWLAGSFATPEKLREAQDEIGAVGIQVGTAFALSNESGFQEHYRARIRAQAFRGELEILTDGRASPSGYPFKVAQFSDTLSDQSVYEARPRLCDIGRLQELYRKEDGTLGMRCPAEPVDEFLQKGGKIEETVGRKCLCNTLFSNLGLGQKQPNGYVEPPLFTLGDDHAFLHALMEHEDQRYSALDVIAYLKGELPRVASRDLVAAAEH